MTDIIWEPGEELVQVVLPVSVQKDFAVWVKNTYPDLYLGRIKQNGIGDLPTLYIWPKSAKFRDLS